MTGLGAFPSFMSWWTWMMAAMMLLGAAPAVFRHAQGSYSVRAILGFGMSDLAIITRADY